MKRILFLIVFTILFHIISIAQSERKFQLWNKNEVEIQPWKNIVIDVAEKIQYTPKQHTIDSKYGELFVYHNALNWLDYGAGFRVAYSNLYPGWLQENRTMLVIELKQECHNIMYKFSNRFEYRNYKIDLDHFRYRQQLSATFPALTNWGMQFFAAEESFHKLNGIGFHLARLSAGVNGIQKEHFQLKIYYGLEKHKLIESWMASDVIAVNMSFVL